MPRLGKDRGSAREDAREQDRARGVDGDQDYAWIKYLGEGRTPLAAADPPTKPAAEPMPRRPAKAAPPPPPPPSAPPPAPPRSDNGRATRAPADYDYADPMALPPGSGNGRGRPAPADYGDEGPLPPPRFERVPPRSPSGGSRGGRTAFPPEDDDTGPSTLPPSGYGRGRTATPSGLDRRRPMPPPGRFEGGRDLLPPGGSDSGPELPPPAGPKGDRPMLPPTRSDVERAKSSSDRDSLPESDSRPVPGRAVRLAAGRPVDLEAGAKDLLFNPAAEEYGQPLYLEPAPSPYGRPAPAGRPYEQDPEPPPRPDRREPRRPDPDRSGGYWPERDTPMDTAEFVSPLYPSREVVPLRPTRARRPAPVDDPLADTDPPLPAPRDRRGRAPQDQPEPLPRRNRAGRTGPQPRIDGPDRVGRREVSLPRRATGMARAIESPAARTAGVVPDLDDEADTGLRGAAARETAARERASRGSGLLDRPRDRPPAPRKSPKREPSKPRKPSVAGGRKGRVQADVEKARTRSRRRVPRKVIAIGVAAVVVVVAVAGVVLFWPKPKHVISTPTTVGSYTRSQADPTAEALKNRIVTAARGDVKNVVASVYKDSAGTPGAPSQIVVFIGGNLAGNASASSLISAYMADMRGSFATSPGKLGGQAACAPGSNGGPAECAWADNDTFGVLVSATLSSSALANEMRLMRPLVEHVKK